MSDTPLRRSALAWGFVTVAPVIAPFAVFCIGFGLIEGEPVMLLYGVALMSLLLWPALLGASVDTVRLFFNWRWRRRSLPTQHIARIHIGEIERFGFRGGLASGMLVELLDGTQVAIPESRFCGPRRLALWADIIAARAEHPVEVVEHRLLIRHPSAPRNTDYDRP